MSVFAGENILRNWKFRKCGKFGKVFSTGMKIYQHENFSDLPSSSSHIFSITSVSCLSVLSVSPEEVHVFRPDFCFRWNSLLTTEGRWCHFHSISMHSAYIQSDEKHSLNYIDPWDIHKTQSLRIINVCQFFSLRVSMCNLRRWK